MTLLELFRIGRSAVAAAHQPVEAGRMGEEDEAVVRVRYTRRRRGGHRGTEGATGIDTWNFTPNGVFAAFGVILPASQAIYAMILKDSAVDEALTKLPL